MEPQDPTQAPDPNSQAPADEAQEPSINADKLGELLARMKAKENIVMATIGGLVAALIGAGIWAAVTIATEYQIGWMAVGIGFLAGFAVRFAGKGVSNHFGYVGAACALLGCVLGNFFTIVGFIAKANAMGFMEVIGQMNYGAVPDMMTATFQPMDLLFYGLALYGGYKASFVKMTEEDMRSVLD